MKFVFCLQCDKLFYAKRSTAKYCGATCRKAASRNQRPTNHYERLDRHEEIAAVIAEQYPSIWRKLEDMRDYHGHKAMRSTLEIVELIIRDRD